LFTGSLLVFRGKCFKVERDFSDRADGELVLTYSRQEITPTTVRICDTSPFTFGMCDVGVSPFDMTKVLAALEADSNRKAIRNIAKQVNQIDRSWIESPCDDSPSCNIADSQPPVFNGANINFEMIEELLYSIDIEEQLAHRELIEKQLSRTTNEALKSFIDRDKSNGSGLADTFKDEEELTVERKEVIYDHAWHFMRSSHERERVLTRNGHLKCHEIVQM
jgi:hypothetical protein